MQKTKITILIPNYNKEKYITQTLNSILIQKTNFNYKILIIDDASTDNSVKIIKGFIKKYPEKIEIIQNKKNLKLLSTIIKGYEQTKTKYFCVLDPDDYWIDENKLQKAIDFLDKHKDFTIYTTNNYIKQKNNKLETSINHESLDFDFNNLSNSSFGHTSGTIFRNIIFSKKIPKAIYDAIGTKDEKIYRGDSFRNYIHLKEGRAHFENSIESVYRITDVGIWTSLNQFQQNLLNSRLYLKLYLYFNKTKPNHFINLCWYFCQKNIELLNKNQQKITDKDMLEFQEILIDCLKNKNLKLKNKIKLKLYSIILNFKKSKTSQIKIIKKIQKIEDK